MFGALKPGFRSLATLKLVVNIYRRILNRNEQLLHRAVSLRQHGFLVFISLFSPLSDHGIVAKSERKGLVLYRLLFIPKIVVSLSIVVKTVL